MEQEDIKIKSGYNKINEERFQLKMIKKLQDFVSLEQDGIIIDFIHGNFVVENKTFVEGKQTSLKIQGIGFTLDLAIDNFIYNWELSKTNKKKQYSNENDYSLYEQYRSYQYTLTRFRIRVRIAETRLDHLFTPNNREIAI